MKTAELIVKYAFEQDQKDKFLGAGSLGAGALALSHPALKKNLTGRETFYHGTDPQNMPAIKQEGIRPSAKPGSTDILEHINPQAAKESRNLSFITPDKIVAREYAVKGEDVGQVLRSNPKANPAIAYSNWQRKAAVDPSTQQRVVNPLNNKGIAEISLPTWKEDIKNKIKANPEVAMGKETWTANVKKVAPAMLEKQRNLIFNVLDKAKGIEGGVSPEFIKGSPKYKGLGLSELGQYIKTKPGSFAKGLGLSTLGLGGIGFGAKKLYDHYTKEASLALPLLETAGLGVLAAPSIGTLRNPNATDNEKSHAKFETAGLGVLAAHPTYELAQAAKKGIQNQIPNMLDSKSPAIRGIGQGIQSFGANARSMLGKVRPMLKLGHSAFYRNILKEA